MKPPSFVNVVIPFDRKWASTVDRRLQGRINPLLGNSPCPGLARRLDEVPGLHYLSITVARPECPAEFYEGGDTEWEGDAHLLIEISSDLGPEETIAQLVARFADEARALLTVAGLRQSEDGVLRFLLDHRLGISSMWSWSCALGQVHCGSPGQSADRILGERALAQHVSAEIDRRMQLTPGSPEAAKWHEMSARQRLDAMRDWLWTDAQTNWKWAFVPEPAPCLGDSPPDELSAANPQIRMAAWRIFHGLAWPFYALLIPLFALWFAYVWNVHDVLTAIFWSLHVLGYTATGALVVMGALYLHLRKLEKRDPVEDRTPSEPQVRDLLAVENFGGQNHLASISRLKPGLFRRLTLRLAFTVVGTGPLVSRPGFLGKNGVIHFARWMRLPNKNQLAFWSNYDDTWESYVADFIADAPSGVTAIWSNCVGFPRARSLFGGGAADRDRLVRWARRQQHPTYFWYQRYRDLTTARIRTNAAIRQGIASAESQQDCADWLSLFGSTPRPGRTLDAPELPTLVFGGLSNFRYAACWGVALGGAKVKTWMQWIRDHATFGEARNSAHTAVAAGFNAKALDRIGVPPQGLATFPVAFQQGMTMEHRSRMLGDVETNDPEGWRWGNTRHEVHAIVVLYATTQQDLATLQAAFERVTRECGHTIWLQQPLRELPEGTGDAMPARESFGFADGVSQPVIRGTLRANRWPNPNDLQEAGEFIHGYPDNTQMIPPSPLVPAWCDPTHILADAGPDSLRKRPEASSYEGSGWRDIGMNGTFLVVRHLRQHTDRLDRWLDDSIKQLAQRGGIDWAIRKRGGGEPLQGEPVVVTLRGPNVARAEAVAAAAEEALQSIASSPAQTDLKDALRAQADAVAPPGGALPGGTVAALPPPDAARHALAAKLIGRWRDGSSLVRHAHAAQAKEERTPDNDFTYVEDPSAIACPFGAHIRRANPRDTRYPGSSEEIDATNRHRLLRVGRSYGNRGEEQGLVFMCLNADIERQFEFVQRTWLLNPQMNGLQGEVDPLLGRGAHKFTVPTRYGPIALPDLPQLVTVVGGGYYFMPSRTALRFLCQISSDAKPVLDGFGKAVVPDLASEPVAHADGLVS